MCRGRAWGQEGGRGAPALGSRGLRLTNWIPLVGRAAFSKPTAPSPSPLTPRVRGWQGSEASAFPRCKEEGVAARVPGREGREGGASASAFPAGRGQQREALQRRGAHPSPASARAPGKAGCEVQKPSRRENQIICKVKPFCRRVAYGHPGIAQLPFSLPPCSLLGG